MRQWLISLLSVVLLGLLSGPTPAAQMPIGKPDMRVGILLFDSVQIIDFAGPREVLSTIGFGVMTFPVYSFKANALRSAGHAAG